MNRVQLFISLLVVFVIIGLTTAYFSKKGDIAAAQQQVLGDEQTLGSDQVRLQRELELKDGYVTLARVYLRDRPTVEKVEENFNHLIANQAQLHHVTFSGAEFGSVNGSIPTPIATGLPGQTNYVPQPQPTPVNANAKTSPDSIGGRLPGDPNVGRPSIDPTLFVRIPVAMRITGNWRDVIASVDDISRSNVMMTVMNPQVTSSANNKVELHLALNLLDPAMPLIPGFETEIEQPTKSLAPPSKNGIQVNNRNNTNYGHHEHSTHKKKEQR